MKSKKKKKQTLLEVAHDMAKGLYEVDAIDATTMREFDVLCLRKRKSSRFIRNISSNLGD